MNNFRRSTLFFSIGILFALLFVARSANTSSAFSWPNIDQGDVWLPLIQQQTPLASRIGYGVTTARDGSQGADIERYPEAESLRAGWYLTWSVDGTPKRPQGIQFAQMVRMHQELECGAFYWDYDNRYAADGTPICPYSDPPSYRTNPPTSRIVDVAQANPGSLWLLGNEMDRIDWTDCANADCTETRYNGQDEMTPALYATAYNELYTLVKNADPTARVAIGGIIQVTPLRMQWLTAAWDAYEDQFGEPMPVDVWNMHAFAIQELRNSWGADIPPSLLTGESGQSGAYVGQNHLHGELSTVDTQVRTFREWMKERGQQQKPLIVSEYGLLYPNGLMGWDRNDGDRVHDFMIGSFDYFLNTKDCDLGYAADDCRLVQKWNWYSLDDQWGGFNEYARLFNPQTGEITEAGVRFREWVDENFSELSTIGGW